MPANLTPEYFKAEKWYRSAITNEEKILALERMLAVMDDIYTQLITVDFPDAITGGLRRNTDMVRGVLERTRGDLTTAVRQEEMKAALRAFGTQVGLPEED